MISPERSSGETMKNIIEESIKDSVRAHEGLLKDEAANIEKAARSIIKSLRLGGKVLIFGNGGSAADSQHLAAELVGRFLKERRALPAIALTTNTSTITAIANDYGYDAVFSRQIEALGNTYGQFMAMSSDSAAGQKLVVRMDGANTDPLWPLISSVPLVLDGSAAADGLTFSYIADTIYGGSGNDFIYAGSALVEAGAGDDTIVAPTASATIHGGDGLDTLRIDSGSWTIPTLAGVERVSFSAGTASLFGAASRLSGVTMDGAGCAVTLGVDFHRELIRSLEEFPLRFDPCLNFSPTGFSGGLGSDRHGITERYPTLGIKGPDFDPRDIATHGIIAEYDPKIPSIWGGRAEI